MFRTRAVLACSDASRPRLPSHPGPSYGRWLWRGGSTRSHPELGSENPLRGWYCRGHPVGEYGAAGQLHTATPASIQKIEAGVAVFVSVTHARGCGRRRGRRRAPSPGPSLAAQGREYSAWRQDPSHGRDMLRPRAAAARMLAPPHRRVRDARPEGRDAAARASMLSGEAGCLARRWPGAVGHSGIVPYRARSPAPAQRGTRPNPRLNP